MNIDKAKKRIAKQVAKGFKGYPMVSIAYFGLTPDVATQVVVQLITEEGAEPQEQKLSSSADARNDETIQTVIVKILERTQAVSVMEVDGVAPL
ncbi:MAG: hypothetical protein ACTMIA_16170 [Vibrio sp.]